MPTHYYGFEEIRKKPRQRPPGQTAAAAEAQFNAPPSSYGQGGGISTSVQADKRLTDYRKRGLDTFGNDQQAIGQIQAKADKLEQDRMARNERRQAGRQAASLDAQRNLALAKIQRAGFSDLKEDQRAAELAMQTLGGIPTESALGARAGVNEAARLQREQTLADVGLREATLAQQGQQFQAQQNQLQRQFQAGQEFDREKLAQQGEQFGVEQQNRQKANIERIAADSYQKGMTDYAKQIEALQYNPEGLKTFRDKYKTAGDYASEMAQNAVSAARRSQQQASPEAKRLMQQYPDATLEEIEEYLRSRGQ